MCTTITMTTPPYQIDDDDVLWWTIEKQWWKTVPNYTDVELLAIFPEARTAIPDKLAEWKQERVRLVRTIRKKLATIQQASAPEHQWFWRAWVKYTDGQTLRVVEAHIARLQRLHGVATGMRRPGALTDTHIQQARAVPLARLVTTPLRPSGKTLVGECPLHEDRRPSFTVYPDTNSWYCFGCQRGGDAIAFVRYLHGFSFRQAVRSLVNL
jgi:hypothetical protein